MLRRLAGALTCAMAISGCSLFSSAPPSRSIIEEKAPDLPPGPQDVRPGKPSLRWKSCGKPFKCARLRVPLDYGNPKGKKIKLALIRLPAPVQDGRLGSLIFNPGGPGGSGVDFIRHAGVETVPAELRAKFDIIGFDPRGVGRSAPVSCGGESYRFLAQRLVPHSSSEVATILSSARVLADACGANGGPLLPHMATSSVARDLDRIRAAVGDEKLNYVGFSYGTFIGMTYAEMFPRRIRSMVLDGPVDPAINGLQRARDQAKTLDRTLRTFFKECRADYKCAEMRLSIGDFNRLVARLDARPVPAALLGPGRSLRSAEALYATAVLLKERGAGWNLLAAGLLSALEGDGSLLLSVAEAGTSRYRTDRKQMFLDPLLAVNCLDVPVPPPSAYPAAATKLAKQSPYFGGLMLLISSPCAYWSLDPQRTPKPMKAAKAPDILVIGTDGDPTTPYKWAVSVAKQLESGHLMTRNAERHTAFGGDNVCTDRAVIDYILKDIKPLPGASCG